MFKKEDMRNTKLVHQNKKKIEKGTCSVIIKKDFQGTKTEKEKKKKGFPGFPGLLVYRIC